MVLISNYMNETERLSRIQQAIILHNKSGNYLYPIMPRELS